MTEMTPAVANARRHTIGDLLRRSAQQLGDKLAVRCGSVDWTYAQFDAICNRLAHGLIARGVAPGDRIAVVSKNSHAFVALRFALARIGAVLVPVNFMLNVDEISFIVNSSGARTLVFGPDYAETAAQVRAKCASVEWMLSLPGEGTPDAPGADATFDSLLLDNTSEPDIALDDRMLAQIVYTSGTESLPKGAMLTHGAIMWQYVTCSVDACMRREDVMLHAMPLFHCAQLDAFFCPAVYLGMTNVITSTPTPDVILPLLEKNAITSFFCPPSIWIALLRSPKFESTDLSKLEKGYYGASIMPVEVLREMQQRLPQVKLWNLYGQTEIAPVATALQPEDQLRKAGSAGKPGINIETRVVDDQMNDVPVGAVGEVVHRSPQLMIGYYNDPEKTAAAFEGGWFHSGDLATVDEEGYITVVDRKKDMIKTGGENVASREVEETVYLLPQVEEVAVVGLPDDRWIEAVTAIVVVRQGESLDEAAVIGHCREKLAHFKAPKRVLFVDALPKNPSGKILKRDLRIRFSEGS